MKVYNNLTGIGSKWIGLQCFIQVTRIVKRRVSKTKKLKTTKETAYFISSLSPLLTSAKEFNQGIRSHWSIENSLHYVKDKTFQEDGSRIRTKNAPQNMSLIRNIAINIFKKHNYDNIAQATRLVANDIFGLWELISA